MTGVSLAAAHAIAAKFPWKDYQTFLDVGTTQGVLPVTVAKHHRHLTGLGLDLAVVESEAHRFGCNAVVVGKTVVHNSQCPKLGEDLTRWGYRSIEVELDEFLKAGGSAKCLTLRVDGEEAAGW